VVDLELARHDACQQAPEGCGSLSLGRLIGSLGRVYKSQAAGFCGQGQHAAGAHRMRQGRPREICDLPVASGAGRSQGALQHQPSTG
jgi:hypothetical protein